MYLMKRLALTFASLLCLLLIAHDQQVMGKENWTRVRSRNFLIVGNAGERELREVATRLEQFRLTLARLFIVNNFASPVPTTVIVFKNDTSYEPFKPLYQGRPTPQVAGYFQPGRDTNYITLSTERLGETPYRTIFHEYVHLMIDSNLRGVPTWLNEGVAEYYSAFEVTHDGRRATLGRAIENHIHLLRRSPSLLPLRTLLSVDHSSPYYNERDKKGLFYAESWALVHYLIQSNEGVRLPELMRYVNLLGAGVPLEEAFRQAFHTDIESLERELASYVRRFNAPLKVVPFEKRLEFDDEVRSSPLTDAQAQYYLGDLLLHMDRFEEAEARLKQALALDPGLGLAYASLGMLRVEQRRFKEARAYLERASASDPQSYLVHYYYAFALSRESMDEEQSTSGYAPETAHTMQAELRRSIELEPGFPEPYHLLAFVHLAMNERLDEAVSLLKRALSLSPGRYEFVNVLAQVYLRQEDYESARRALEPLVRASADRQVREQAQSMLNVVVSLEESARRSPSIENNLKMTERALASEARSELTLRPVRSVLRKRFEGERVRGLLTDIECTETGVLLSVTVGEHTLKLHNNSLRRITFVTYVPEIKGQLTCGARAPANSAIVTYRPAHHAGSEFDGEAVAIEFIPNEEFEMEK
jgi:tetratricopeptide (TPR) repeat protein